MDNFINLIEQLAWLRIVCYGVICAIFIHRANNSIRYREMNYALSILFLVGIFLSVAIIVSPHWIIWLRAAQTPTLIVAAIYGTKSWLKDVEVIANTKRETGLVFLNNQPCSKEEDKGSKVAHSWELKVR